MSTFGFIILLIAIIAIIVLWGNKVIPYKGTIYNIDMGYGARILWTIGLIGLALLGLYLWDNF